MVKRPSLAVVLLGLLATGLGAWSWLRAGGARELADLGLGAAEPRVAEQALPRIGLERLKALGSPEPGGTPVRDVFRFGRAKEPSPVAHATPATTLPAEPVDAAPVATPPPPALPPFGVKFIGSLEQRGTRVAVLLSDDKKEVLTGREGDTVANRLRIVKIGFESVEVQDVGSDRVRRIPLKGN